MARTVASAVLAATPQDVWAVVGDAHHLPRWWPGVTRVEAVHDHGFTQVIPTKRGKPVRLDYTLVEFVPERCSSWSQELAGTPFERLLSSWTVSITIEPVADGSQVTIVEDQRLRGSFRLGRLLQTRPARKRVAQAIRNLAALLD